MKKISMRFLLIAFFHWSLIFCQELSSVTAPNAASIMTFDNISVGLHTGVPDISVPLYTMPTLSNELSVNLALNYHPYSAGYNSIVGSGWSVPLQGSITRDYKNTDLITRDFKDDKKYYDHMRTVDPTLNEMEGTNLFQLSAPGLSMRFKLKFINNDVNIIYADLEAGEMRIVPNYNPATNELSSFTVYDYKGLTYIFDKSDLYFDSPYRCFEEMKSVWVLTKIYDNNGHDLITYNYSLKPYNYAGITCYNTTQGYAEPNLNSLTVHGIGTIEITTSASVADRIVIKDNNDNVIRAFDLSYQGFLNRTLLKKIEISNLDINNTQQYLFNYKNIINIVPGSLAIDSFGFYKDNQCMPDMGVIGVDPDYCDTGLLESIVYPTGGMVAYEFEPNTFTDTEEENSSYEQDFHNNTAETMLTLLTEFNINQPGYYYLNLLHVYANQTSGSNEFHEIVDLDGNQAETFRTIFEHASSGTQNFSPYIVNGQQVKFAPNERNSNHCQGKKIYLQVGRYRFNSSGDATIIYELKRRNVNNVINLWHYAEGVRIKSIAQYEGNRYDNEDNPIPPVRKINYLYHNFGNSLTSSSVNNTAYTDDTNFYTTHSEPVGYKNVTVYETGKGRTEYTFLTRENFLSYERERIFYASDGITSITVTDHYTPYSFWQKDLEKKRQVFDKSGRILSEINTTYDFSTFWRMTSTVMNPSNVYATKTFYEGISGYITDVKKEVNESFYKHDGTQFIKSSNNHTKYLKKNLIDSTTSSFSDGTEKTDKFTYQDYAVIFPTQAILNSKPLAIQSYKNGELISKKTSEYAQFPGNVKYLPSRTLSQKGDNQPEVNFIATKYDQYDNLLEGRTEAGITTSVIYGYNKTMVIAKIANASYAQIATALNLNVAEVAQLNENNLTIIDSLRTLLPNASVTTYTHRPLIGVSTIKDARGKVTSYYYDGLGRLKQVKDDSGATLTENTYNYQPNQD